MKDLAFIGSSQDDLRAFPEEARRDAGFQLHFVQRGLEPSDWKYIQSVGVHAIEIRIRLRREWRIIYVASFSSAVFVLHAFEKKTQKTRQADIELARKRYREVERREQRKARPQHIP